MQDKSVCRQDVLHELACGSSAPRVSVALDPSASETWLTGRALALLSASTLLLWYADIILLRMSKPPKEKSERPTHSVTNSRTTPVRAPSPRRMLAPPLSNPNIVVSQPIAGPDEQEFSRRLKISPNSPRSSHSKAQNGTGSTTKQLYNPNADSIRRSMMTSEPDAMSDGASSSYAHRGVPAQSSSTLR